MAARSLIANSVLEEDLSEVVDSTLIDWQFFANRSFLITGATGLIGGFMVRALSLANKRKQLGMRIVGIARHQEEVAGVEMLSGDVTERFEVNGNVDFIIHGACPTASKFFVEHPVETMRTAIVGTANLLELARQKRASKMIYLSSMEMYGELPDNDFRATEDRCGFIDPLAIRSSYPQAKRTCETLCACYSAEYGIPVVTARIAQTVGACVQPSDTRLFVQLAKCVLEGRDIVLHSDGSKAHCCIYLTDVITGLLKLLQSGEAGQAYNVANENTFSSVREIAEMAVSMRSDHSIRLVYDIPDDVSKFGYPRPSKLLVDASKLRALGWAPKYTMSAIFARLCAGLKEQNGL